jgi:hypothetical protein
VPDTSLITTAASPSPRALLRQHVHQHVHIISVHIVHGGMHHTMPTRLSHSTSCVPFFRFSKNSSATPDSDSVVRRCSSCCATFQFAIVPVNLDADVVVWYMVALSRASMCVRVWVLFFLCCILQTRSRHTRTLRSS